MKQLWSVIMCSLMWFAVCSQNFPLAISTDKTTSLVFPFAIKHVDRGNKDVLVQPVKDVNNVLLVKASNNSLTETNLSVLTEDGNMYSFDVRYTAHPAVSVYHLPVNKTQTISSYSQAILDNPRIVNKIKEQKSGIAFRLDGVYIKDNIGYYQFFVKNSSNINYDVELIRFFIRDKKKLKRTAVQELELVPLLISGNARSVKAGNSSRIAVALDKFTIPDAKYFGIQLFEKNGGRHLFLRLQNKQIMQAVVLPDLR